MRHRVGKHLVYKQLKHKTMKLDSSRKYIEFSRENNTEKAVNIWHTVLTPMQRIELRDEIGANKYSQINRQYNSCINYIADNLDKFLK